VTSFPNWVNSQLGGYAKGIEDSRSLIKEALQKFVESLIEVLLKAANSSSSEMATVRAMAPDDRVFVRFKTSP
jgi:hypothetical protein